MHSPKSPQQRHAEHHDHHLSPLDGSGLLHLATTVEHAAEKVLGREVSLSGAAKISAIGEEEGDQMQKAFLETRKMKETMKKEQIAEARLARMDPRLAMRAEMEGLMSPSSHQDMLTSPIRVVCFHIVSSSLFDLVMAILILMNAICMGVETDMESYGPDTETVITALNHVFLAIFTVELTLQLLAYRLTFLRTGWGRFDCFIVLSGIVSTWIMPFAVDGDGDGLQLLMVLRVLRLLKLARAVRLMSQFKMLWMLVQGLRHGLVALSWAFVTATIILYTFGIFGVELIGKDVSLREDELVQEHFGNVSKSMFTLVQIMTLDSWSGFVRPLVFRRPILFAYFIIYIGLCSIVLLNLVTAMIVETSSKSAETDKEAQRLWEEAIVFEVCQSLETIFSESDVDGSGDMSKQELVTAYNTNTRIRNKIDAVASLDDLLDLFQFCDYDESGALSVKELTLGYAEYQKDPIKFVSIETHKLCKCIFKHLKGAEPTRVESPASSPSKSDLVALSVQQSALAAAVKAIAAEQAEQGAVLRRIASQMGTIAGPVVPHHVPKPPPHGQHIWPCGNQWISAKD